MITLKTLPNATAQEVFDQVANHLLTQNQKSEDNEGLCFYKNRNLKCAVGCLISEEEYSPEFENQPIFSLNIKTHIELLQKLQRLHDNKPIKDWKNELKIIAYEFDLKVNFK